MKQHVFRPSRMVDGRRQNSRLYSGRYRLKGDSKETQVSLHVTDKRVAQSKLAELVKREELERHGLLAPREQREAFDSPLCDLVREWVCDLGIKGRKPDYRRIMGLTINRLIVDCRWKTLADVRPESFMTWRCSNGSKSAKTLNEYLGCVRAFLTWLVKCGKLASNPLASVDKVETRGREVRRRRSFSHDEFLRLVAAGGEVRGVVYALAYYTGLRRSEIASLRWGDFDWAAASVTIRAEHAKNRREVSLPLHPDLREMLLGHFEACGRPSGSVKALDVPPRLRAFDQDLKVAGIVKLNDLGQVADFHCLRHSCATRLASQNVPLPVAMRIMRHSDPKLTAKHYVDQAALPLLDAIANMPGMANGVSHSPIHSPVLPVSGHSVAKPVASEMPEISFQTTVDELLRRVLSHLGATGQMVAGVGFEPTTFRL